MKKLMFAAIAGVAITGYSVESSNVVGYMQVNNAQMNTYQVAMFNKISDEGYSIQDLVPVGATVTGEGEVTIMTLNADKSTAQTFYYFTDEGWGTDCGEDGWFEDKFDTSELSNYVFDPGEGFIFSSQKGVASLTYSGEVKCPVELEFRQANTITGNFWPMNMPIQSLQPSGAAVLGEGEITIMTMNTDKSTKKTFYYFTDDGWGTDCGEDGWFEDKFDTSELSSYAFAPGEGFIFCSQKGIATVTFPEL